MFDFFRKPRPDQPPISKTQDEPRPQHYVFAHRLMPVVAQQDGLLVAGILGDEDGAREFLLEQWQEAARLSGSPISIAPDGLGAMVRRHEEWIIAIIGLPLPIATTEAFFVAIAGQLPEAEDFEALRAVPTRYFTLEKGWTMGGEPRTVLGEWNDQGHLNYGDGCAPVADSFYDLVVTVLGETPPVLGGTRRPPGDD